MNLKKTAEKLSGYGAKCVNATQRFLDITVRRPASSIQRFVELVLLKYLYMFLTVTVLKGLWYQGTGGYHIDFVFWKECIASAVFLAVAWLYLRLEIRDIFVKNLMLFLFVLYYIPINSAFSINNTTFGFFILTNLYYILVIVGVWFCSWFAENKLKPRKQSPRISSGKLFEDKFLNLICFAGCVLYIIHKLDYNGFDFSLTLTSGEIYANRAEYQEYIQKIGGSLFSYLLAVVRYLVSYMVPFYLVSALIRKKPVALGVIVLCVLSMYAVSSQKSTLLTPLLAVAVYVLYRLKVLDKMDRVFIYGMILLMLVCIAEHFVLDTDRIYMLLVRREMFIPAWMNTLYYDFFSQNDKLMWTQNVFLLQNIFEPVYDLSPLELINNAYFKGTVPSPNTGMFAEAYMHFGVFGTFLYPVLLSLCFTIFGRIYRGYGSALQIMLAIRIAISAVNVPLTRTNSILSIFLFAFILMVISLFDAEAWLRKIWEKVRASKLFRK